MKRMKQFSFKNIKIKPLQIMWKRLKELRQKYKRKHFKPSEAYKRPNNIVLTYRELLRISERFANKWLNWLVNGEENPVPKIDIKSFALFFGIVLIILIIALFVR